MGLIVTPWQRQPPFQVDLKPEYENSGGWGGLFYLSGRHFSLTPAARELTNAAPTAIPTPQGMGGRASNNYGATDNYPGNYFNSIPGAPHTLIMQYRPGQTTANRGYFLIAQSTIAGTGIKLGKGTSFKNYLIGGSTTNAEYVTARDADIKNMCTTVVCTDGLTDASPTWWENGTNLSLTVTQGVGSTTTGLDSLFVGRDLSNPITLDTSFYLLLPYRISEERAEKISRNPYAELFMPMQRRSFFSVTAGGSTGSLDATESGSDTAAFAGDVYVSGTLAVTETGADTASIAGDVIVSGALVSTESGTDTAAFTGSAVGIITGSLSATESGSDTAAIAGDVYVSGTMGATETGSDTAAITGSLLVHGTLAATESGSDTAFFNGSSTVITSGAMAAVESGTDTASVTGKVIVAGAMAASESGQDTAAISGDVLVIGTLAATESGQDAASISGNVRVAGSFSATETGNDTAAFIGTGDSIRTGTLAATETGQDSASMTGRVLVLGELAAFEVDFDQAHFTNSAEIFGVLSAVETGLDTAAFRPKEFVTPGWTIYGLPRSWRIAS